MLERVPDIIQKHDNIKIHTAFNDEFESNDKRANKSVNTKNYELFHSSNLEKWYEWRVVEPILTSLEKFQNRDSGWTHKFDRERKQVQSDARGMLYQTSTKN